MIDYNMVGFRGLQNYTTLKQSQYLYMFIRCFRGLQNYTTLKQTGIDVHQKTGFRGLQNYTTLKPQIKFEAQE